MAKAPKYYVVWRGRRPGLYTSWADCEAQVKGFPEAQFKAFATRAAAEEALRGRYEDYEGQPILNQQRLLEVGPPETPSVAVDAACRGYPGPVEYRGVDTHTRAELFREGPFPNGSNNIGEFLAIVHALALLQKQGLTLPVYSDSELALEWVKAGRCRTQLAPDAANRALFERLTRAEQWLRDNPYPNRLLKWDTQAWGENPADFGRK
jgi:ribonuclease HI